MQSTKQAVFMLGEDGYSLDIMDVIAIEKLTAIKTVSSFPKNFKGVMVLRGDKIPIYSLRNRFGMQDVLADDDTRLIITSVDGLKIGFEVDKMTEIVQVDETQVNEVPPIVKEEDTSYMKSVIKVNDQLILMLDPKGIMPPEDFNMVKTVINGLE